MGPAKDKSQTPTDRLNFYARFVNESEACPIVVHLTQYLNTFYDGAYTNIGITHVISCINICRVPRMLFEHEADRPSVQHHPRDPASVNAMKQTCLIVILAYFTLFQPNSH